MYIILEVYMGTVKQEYIKNVIRKNISNMSQETVNRRASTISGWIQWIISAQI